MATTAERRAAQGLPPTVEDPHALEQIAAILRDMRERRDDRRRYEEAMATAIPAA